MRDYWLTQYLLAAVGWTYIVVCLAAIALALWLPKTKRSKAVSGAIVLALASILPIQGFQAYRVEKTVTDDYKVRLAKAQALFDERCKTAGEKIYRTVGGVAGVLLTKVRPEKINFSDQYALDDPYGYDFGGAAYIASFLWGRDQGGRTWEGGTAGGFSFVEVIDDGEKERYRYTATSIPMNDAASSTKFVVSRTKAPTTQPRYAVTWTDISTGEDRNYWIAGGSIKIIDRTTNEILGERVGYMLDAGQGSTSGERSPWLFAQQNACPEFPTIGGSDARRRRSSQINRNFIESILKPS